MLASADFCISVPVQSQLFTARAACGHSQLEDDGFHGAAAMVAQTTMIRAQQLYFAQCAQPALCSSTNDGAPSPRAACQRQEKDRLGKLVRIGQRAVQQSGRRIGTESPL